MSSLNDLLARASEFVRAGGQPDEREDALVLRGRFADAATQASWLSIASNPPPGVTHVHVYDLDVGGELASSSSFDEDRTVTITLTKPVSASVGYLFFQSSLTGFFQRAITVSRLRIADLPRDGCFAARGLEVVTWNGNEEEDNPRQVASVCPTKLVSDYVPHREIVADLSPWIILSPPALHCEAFVAWRDASSRRLLGGLVSSAYLENDEVWLQASGPPVFRICVRDAQIVDAWEELTEAVKWVYLSGFDIEARQRLFNGELARADRPAEALRVKVRRAHESAAAAYEAHVQSSSRETLKVLAELRKTVIEETQRVSQRAQEMTSNLWRDVAVSIVPFIVKIVGDSGRPSPTWMPAAFYFAAAIFIFISFTLQWRINKAYFQAQSMSRQQWLSTLFSYISEEERKKIAEDPIDAAIASYREVRLILLFVYGALILILVGAGIHGLEVTKANAASPRGEPRVSGSPQAVAPTVIPAVTPPRPALSPVAPVASPPAPSNASPGQIPVKGQR